MSSHGGGEGEEAGPQARSGCLTEGERPRVPDPRAPGPQAESGLQGREPAAPALRRPDPPFLGNLSFQRTPDS